MVAQMNRECDYLIIGGGVMGLAVAKALLTRAPQSKIILIEKEEKVAVHSSGRSSGVLHAGFYYTADTLKAKFSVAGNRAWREFCSSRGLALNQTGKLVVANEEREIEQLYELERRGKANGSQVEIISEEQAKKIEPNVRTLGKALWSPLTATVDPREACETLAYELQSAGVQFSFSDRYLGREGSKVRTQKHRIEAGRVINCAGLYADKIAHEFGFGKKYTIVPFKGLYLKYTKNTTDLRTNIYPVPNLKQTFLGVHYTITAHRHIKIGPTAIPAFWRENYAWNQNFRLDEFAAIALLEAKLFLTNAFGFRTLALEEMKKYSKDYLISLASKMAAGIDPKGFTEFGAPGIRAQLVNKETLELVMDFIVEGDGRSTHLLNAISPGFTCSLPFAEYVLDKHVFHTSESSLAVESNGAPAR